MNLNSFFLILAICVGFLMCSRTDFVPYQPMIDESVIVEKILRNFFENHFGDKNVFVCMTISPFEKERNHFQDDLITLLVINLAQTGFSYNILNKLEKNTLENRIPFHLIVVDDSKQLQQIFDEIAVQEIHMSQKFLVIVTGSTKNDSSTLNEAFHLLWKNGLIHSHVLIRDTTNTWSLYTYLPYQNDCNALSLLKIDSFTRLNFSTPMKLNINQLYPRKLKTFNGCPVYVAPWLYKSFFTLVKSSEGNYYYDGFEAKIVNNIAKALNASVVYNVSFIEEKDGTIINNGTFEEWTRMVETNIPNISMGGLQKTVERERLFSPSHSYLRISMHFMYKDEIARIKPIASLISPLNINLWLIVLLLLYTAILLILMSKPLTRKWRHFYIGGRMNRTPILNAWAAALGQSIANPRIASGRSFSNFARSLIIFWIILWFAIRSAYEGALYSFLQDYRPPSPYDTIEKVLASDCKILANSGAYSTIKHLIKKQRWVVDDSWALKGFLHFYDSDIDGVVYKPDTFLNTFNFINAPMNRRLLKTKDRLFTGEVVLYFRKKSILRDVFNEKLRRLSESGITEYLVAKYMNEQQMKLKHRSQPKLYIENIFGALQICAVMYSISFIVLCLEVISLIHPPIRFFIDYLTY